MPVQLFHRPHLIDGDWSTVPLSVREHYADEDGIQLIFVIDNGPDGPRDLLFRVEPKDFAVWAEMMMRSAPKKATAAFSAALSGKYPLDKVGASKVQTIHKIVG
jgi:hypothetical protein